MDQLIIAKMLQVQLLNKLLKVSKYNTAVTVGMTQSYFMILNNEFMSKDPDVVLEQAPIILLDIKSAVFVANNVKVTKHAIHISKIIHLVRNGE